MVQINEQAYLLPDKSINLELWLDHLAKHMDDENIDKIRSACVIAQLAGELQATPSGISCLQEGLATAEILFPLQPSSETLAAAILFSSVIYGDLEIQDVEEQLGKEIAKLISGVLQMGEIHAVSSTQIHAYDHRHIDNFRKMLVSMVEDPRIVLIKLAERAQVLHAAPLFESSYRKQIAKEALEIYAPLANRLGVHQIKWQLEDLGFRHLEPDTYRNIAKMLDSKRIEREQYVDEALTLLKTQMSNEEVGVIDCYGRAKHIYSIYSKMQRKKVGIDEIYDALAIRVITKTIEDCYKVLSIVHTEWEQIPKEFDDYIATPKSNGYQSIHTAVIGPGRKSLEVQIRTHNMHELAELGVAAHWHYKQGGKRPTQEGKIAWLSQVLSWQKEVISQDKNSHDPLEEYNIEDRVYVFTPTGEIKDLPLNATPLDFAYQVHTEIGHRCKGAKINGKIVPLTQHLKTGDKVEILTHKKPQPSRDWLVPKSGFLVSPRARAKVHHWFKEQDYDKHLEIGRQLLKSEIQRLKLKDIDMDVLTKKLHYKTQDDLTAALGRGDVRITQIIGVIQQQEAQQKPAEETVKTPITNNQTGKFDDIFIEGVGNLLTHVAKCCKPVPGDAIIGYITRGQGVSIHAENCANILHAPENKKQRFINVNWSHTTTDKYPIDITIEAIDRHELLRDITSALSLDKINLLGINSHLDPITNKAMINFTIAVNETQHLEKILARLRKIKNVLSAKRV